MSEPWSSAAQPQWEQPTAPSTAPEGTRKQPWALLIGGAVALTMAAGVGGFFVGQGTAGGDSGKEDEGSSGVAAIASPVESAFERCESRDTGNTLSLEDDGATIVVDTRSEYGDSSGMACVLNQLDTPQSITAQMDRTTAMMGVQDATSDGIEYSWSYHPDNGVNMVITAAGSSN